MSKMFYDKFDRYMKDPSVPQENKERALEYKMELESTSRKFSGLMNGLADSVETASDEDILEESVGEDIEKTREVLLKAVENKGKLTVEGVQNHESLLNALKDAYDFFGSWSALAEALEVSQLTIINWRKGEKKPQKSKLKKFVELYNKTVADDFVGVL